MKKAITCAILAIGMASLLSSCNENKKTETPAPEPPKEVYQPVSQSITVDLTKASRYDYCNAPSDQPATNVSVTYDQKRPYAQPIVIAYTYANGDSYTYTIPQEFGLWKNEAGNFRVVVDEHYTVWLQGQTKAGKRHEFVFYGDPQYNGRKIKVNSYKGTITYR